MNHRIANAHVISRLAKYTRALPHHDCKCCGVSVASRQARTGAVCNCSLRVKLVGDGCAVCNPEYAAQFEELRNA